MIAVHSGSIQNELGERSHDHQPNRNTYKFYRFEGTIASFLEYLALFFLRKLPELRQFPEEKQGKVLQKARDCALESVELIGIAVWLVIVTSFAKFILNRAGMDSDHSMTLAVNIVVDVPLLAVVFIPI